MRWRSKAVLVTILVLVPAGCQEPSEATIPDGTLQQRYGFGVQAEDQPPVLSAAEAEADLFELQEILEDRFAYLEWLGVDYRPAIQEIRAGLGDSIDTGDFALQIHKMLALFGDGHTQVPSRPDYLPEVYLPVSLGDAREGVVAYWADGSGLADDELPLLTAIDGVPLEELVEAMERFVHGGSPQLVRRRALEFLYHPPLWREVLDLPNRDRATLTLSSVDGSADEMLEVELMDDDSTRVWHWLDDERWPYAEHRTLEEEKVGYLRIRRMGAESDFVDLLHSAMNDFGETEGLIIDVRGNSGGNRAALMNLFPYLMPPSSPPHITNVARYRLTPEDEPGDPEGYLDDRYLYPATASHLGEDERAAMERFAEEFDPAWSPPDDRFSDWHYLLHTPRDTVPFYHYDRPVVILQDEACFSATDIFLSGFQAWPGVTLLGTPSGGGSGRTQRFYLENSNIPVRISSMASFLVDGRLMDGTGVVPDVLVRPSVTDFARKTDTVLEAALELIDGGG